MQDIHNLIKTRLKAKDALIGIVGLGYVGLPLMLRYNAIGYRVLGIDIDESKISKLNAGQSYIEHIPAAKISEARASGFEATADFSRVADCDALILCVPTPLNKYREPDMSFVINTTDALKPYLRAGQVVSLESTTYPGTTEEELLPRVEESGLRVGENIFLVYSPEREDPGNPDFETRTIPKVIGGHTNTCLEVGIALYEQAIDQVVPVSSTKAAEMTKLLENIHRAVNIGLVNEMKIVADRMGIDIFEVVDAAATKPFGFTPYYPGPGLGGHCIPIDPFYLTWKAREYGLHTRFIELSGEVNRSMPEYVVGKLMDGLNERGKPVKGSRILVLGIAYKKNVDDMRESPSVEIMELIEAKGGIVAYSDPHVETFPKMRQHHFELTSEALTPQNLASFDAVVLATDHERFDYEQIRQHSKLLIDSRGKYRLPEDHIIKA
ncbi:UDP-N-acetyl-D-glucosamine 6-dehydrogenase [Pseudomonas cichorii]|nr:nucleotide sugar dehydrogenase [Pseudomonas cichorii]MBX8539422.1 UDP-N-acetyl-D-glucosamine 6-dehydrogenase [Pseudomonas cichorii]MBX8547374.1 UDP-N-acetyl-D-glucosamine 6-dehydrogenase [Pseudomonas cichorii]MBX8561094.1 UDP-N-acetyl-D-glucosamine 6-dehydrogenase [Pseudomonas cichorii]MBX8564849.1 UDP-N-acetyl-D-glucosamine 6-dehydrogenase [Pseudomonas cichorii]MBX8579350.1 UDP-N-acetyl-D-glucosamine 6-dehydrogenase [Pseudomonas cichorii]